MGQARQSAHGGEGGCPGHQVHQTGGVMHRLGVGQRPGSQQWSELDPVAVVDVSPAQLHGQGGGPGRLAPATVGAGMVVVLGAHRRPGVAAVATHLGGAEGGQRPSEASR